MLSQPKSFYGFGSTIITALPKNVCKKTTILIPLVYVNSVLHKAGET